MSEPLSKRLLISFFKLINRFIPWHRLRKYIGALNLLSFRETLRKQNLHNTRERPLSQGIQESVPGNPLPTTSFDPGFLYRRSADGSYNDLSDPMMGAAHTRFGRNVPLEVVTRCARDPNILVPSPRLVSEVLLARTDFKPATWLNLLAAAWIQFMTHDWFHHGVREPRNGTHFTEVEVFEVPVADGKFDGGDEAPHGSMWIRRTADDSTRIDPKNDGGPPTFLNDGSHWWDASQIYGNSDKETEDLRCAAETVEWRDENWEYVKEGTPGANRVVRDTRGELKLTEDRLLPWDDELHRERTGLFDNWWIGLSLMHTLFAQEHNAIAQMLRAEYPYWESDRLFHTARLINVAVMAKIHTVEWTPAILNHPAIDVALNANWSGFLTARITDVFGRFGTNEEISGIPGSSQIHHGVPFSLTEEFVAVYRLHPLMPEAIRFYKADTGKPVKDGRPFPLPELLNDLVRPFMVDAKLSMADVCYSFAIANPGAPVLQNYPQFLRHLERPERNFQHRVIDLASIDIMRDRERGVPRYNEFRELLHRGRISSYDEITSDNARVKLLRKVYGTTRDKDGVERDNVDRVDLMAGMYAEDFPEGFGFSDTAFRVFILMASRRIKSDRYLTTDYNANVYTQAGMDWIAKNNMRSVILRHFPEVGPALSLVTNAFHPWPNTPPTSPRPTKPAPAPGNVHEPGQDVMATLASTAPHVQGRPQRQDLK